MSALCDIAEIIASVALSIVFVYALVCILGDLT